VARILVADDNSNIQKMVGLALKDQGIDVVAVGNGEAAVRKISDLRPDLVLADVFMPVRNGYEVCKYVKDDASLAHIPVILLVGAFDPLDEQEAQRVGADGVLKKPFVPPDPLISMVKSALQRAGAAKALAADKGNAAAMIGAPTTSGGAAITGKSTQASGPTTAGGPNGTVVSVAPTVLAMTKEGSGVESQSFVDEIPAKPEALNIESAGKPLAFGSLMETSAAEIQDDAVYVAAPSPELADRDWNGAEEQDEEEEEEESAWRRDGGSEEFAPETVTETAAEKTVRTKRRESWTPTREEAAPEFMPSFPAPAPAVISEAAAPQNSWNLPKQAETEFVESKPTDVAVTPIETAPPVIAPAIATVPEEALPETAKPSEGNSWFSTSSSPWEAEAQKANQLASTWDAAAAPVVAAASEAIVEQSQIVEPTQVLEQPQPEATLSYDFVSEAPSDEPVHYVADPGLVGNEIASHDPLPDLISDGSISPETVETIRQETSYALESVVQPKAPQPVEAAAKISEASQQDMDTLVANVLAKMSPEMLQAVTREILKPVVAAMIREEINGKKP
jgi:CheY-like chemotaxis protein